MNSFVERNPFWSLVILVAVALALWLIFATWPPGLEDAIGKKKVFLNAVFNGITLGGLYFLVASGFTLIFGLMRNVNLAHGSLYLFGGYIGYDVSVWTGSWLLAFVVAFVVVALVGVADADRGLPPHGGPGSAQTMVTIGLSIVFADLMLWAFGGDFYQIQTPGWLVGPMQLPFVTAVKSSGEAVYLSYPHRTPRDLRRLRRDRRRDVARAQSHAHRHDRARGRRRPRHTRRDGRADPARLRLVFAFGAGLAGMAGVVGGTFQSLSPGEDTRFLLASLVVVIVGGMGSIPGAALGAVIIGLAEQLGLGLHPDLRHRRDLPHHGARAGRAAAGPAGEALDMALTQGARACRAAWRPAPDRGRRGAGRIRRPPHSGSSRPSC